MGYGEGYRLEQLKSSLDKVVLGELMDRSSNRRLVA
jgi:hypothetical protein